VLLLLLSGDSRAVLCRKGSAIPLTNDHKPDRSDEAVRRQLAVEHSLSSSNLWKHTLATFRGAEADVAVIQGTAVSKCLHK
jgi:serine/threonine protein phosphatase PrpC